MSNEHEPASQIRRGEQPQRSENVCPTCGAFGLPVAVATSEPQEWTPEYVDCRLLKQAVVPWKTVCAVAAAHNAAIAAERIILNNVRVAAEEAQQQLLAAQAANLRLVEALEAILPRFAKDNKFSPLIKKAEAALASAKERP